MRRFTILFFFIVILDQFTKFISSFISHQVYINPGISFAWLATETQVLIIALTLFIIIGLGLGYGYFWAKHPMVAGLFFGGAFSNLIDRLLFGGVRDWLTMPIIGLRNNLADIAIVVSVLIMLWYVQKGVEDG